MKFTHVYAMFLMYVFCISCGGPKKQFLSKETINSEITDVSNVGWIDTKYEYIDSVGKRLILQNSLPKGGQKYTDPDSEVYTYVVFFTRIINETDNALELKIDFPIDSYEVPSLPGKYFKILVPSEAMTLDKASLYAYGLTNLESFLDKSIHKSSSLNKTINPKDSIGFYVVMLCLTEGAKGTMRTGLSLRGQNIFYRVKIDGSKNHTKSTDKEIHCGSINLKNLRLQKKT